MSALQTFKSAGHSPTLFAAFLYFAFSCCIWVLNGALAPFISEAYHLKPAQQGLMLSIPLLAGALGLLSQAVAILIPMIVIIVFAKEPPDVDAHAAMREHLACLFEGDGWAFSLTTKRFGVGCRSTFWTLRPDERPASSLAHALQSKCKWQAT